MSEKFDQLKIMQEMFPNATFVDANGERVADTSKTIDHIADTSKKASLTEQYKTRTLQNDFYYFDNGKTQYIVEYHNIKGFEGLDGVKVLERVPSYEKWKSLNQLLDSSLETNKALAHRLNICKELLKEWIHYYPIILYEYEDTLKTKDIVELFDKTREALK